VDCFSIRACNTLLSCGRVALLYLEYAYIYCPIVSQTRLSICQEPESISLIVKPITPALIVHNLQNSQSKISLLPIVPTLTKPTYPRKPNYRQQRCPASPGASSSPLYPPPAKPNTTTPISSSIPLLPTKTTV